MTFVSAQFFIIVCVTIIFYYIYPPRFRWHVLLVSSCIFYISAVGVEPFLVSIFTIAVTYCAANMITRTHDNRKKQRFYLTIVVIILLGLLSVFKLKSHMNGYFQWIAIPLGVSYYTFSLIGYLADIYYKKGKAEENFLKLSLYTLYFPKIMQGPISKYREIGPRLIKGHLFNYKEFCFGIQLIIWGYFKKLVIADRTALLTDTVFKEFGAYSNGGAILLVATFLATICHYCDFSGYMDIVIGISQMMGICLESNFKQPFFSRSAAEFWRKWHITLGIWFKDYVYMPLVISPRIIKISNWIRKHFGKRFGKSMLTVIPLAIVWFLTGLWHGTGLDYILWGMYWGIIIIFSNIFAPELKKIVIFFNINIDSSIWHIFQMVRTFLIFVGGLLISTFVGRKYIKLYFWNVFKFFNLNQLLNGSIFSLGLDKENMVVLVAAIFILLIVEIFQQKGSVRERIAGLNAVLRWAIYAGALIIVILFGIYGPGYDASGFAYTFF